MKRARSAAVVAVVALGVGCGDSRGSAMSADACPRCHVDEAARASLESSHSILFDCTFCHAPSTDDPGSGHRSIVDCVACHSETSHPPSEVPGDGEAVAPSCVRCHDPHGTPNLRLIRETIAEVAITFDNYVGYAPGSYAEPGPLGIAGLGAGTGPCEVCHDATFTYRHDGGGLPHHQKRCTQCHTHASGFRPSHGEVPG